MTCLCAANSPMTGEFLAQRASNAENVSIWWCHLDMHQHQPTKWKGHFVLYNLMNYWLRCYRKTCIDIFLLVCYYNDISRRLLPFHSIYIFLWWNWSKHFQTYHFNKKKRKEAPGLHPTPFVITFISVASHLGDPSLWIIIAILYIDSQAPRS